MWNLDPPPGFRGLSDDRPLHVYYRNLPHWRQDGATYFVTYRLADSLPQTKLNELRALKRAWEHKHGSYRTKEAWDTLARDTMRRVEGWLDQGMGTCSLCDRRVASAVAKTMCHFDGNRYELGSYVVMPNHVHVIIRPLVPADYPLEGILQSWKGYLSREFNQILGSSGRVWQNESFDRIIRHPEHLWRALQYIGRNPSLAKVPIDVHRPWVRPEWESIGWKFTSK